MEWYKIRVTNHNLQWLKFIQFLELKMPFRCSNSLPVTLYQFAFHRDNNSLFIYYSFNRCILLYFLHAILHLWGGISDWFGNSKKLQLKFKNLKFIFKIHLGWEKVIVKNLTNLPQNCKNYLKLLIDLRTFGRLTPPVPMYRN